MLRGRYNNIAGITARAAWLASPRGDRMNLPELFVTGLDEGGDFPFKRWCPPPVGEFATPADLARIIAAFRDWVRANAGPGFQPITEQGAISEQGLGKLLLLAYQASFYTDEGRYTRARIFVQDVNRQAHPVQINHLFTPPKRLFGPKISTNLRPRRAPGTPPWGWKKPPGGWAGAGAGLLSAQAPTA